MKTKYTFNESSLRLMYEMLHATVMVPLDVRLPPEWLVTFEVSKDPDAYGWANPEDDAFEPFGEYTLEVSKVKNKTYKDVMETMLHEMIHIHLHHIGREDWDEHTENSGFEITRERVEAFTGLSIS
jgi:hypothetical protein